MKIAQRIVLTYYSTKLKAIELFFPSKAAEAAFELFCTPYSKRRVYEVPEVFRQAEKLTFSLGNIDIHGFCWKPAVANGYKVLVCHGFDSYSYKFAQYIQPLLNEGFEVYAFDAPAHGLSSGKTITALLYKEMILEVVKKYGVIYGVIAHSFGGIAVSLAVEVLADKAPKRLVLIAPATETTRSINDFCYHVKISRSLKKGIENLIVQIGGKDPSWYSVARVIKSISIPTLWIHDLHDTTTPYEDMKHLINDDLQHVQFVITDGLGHSPYRNEGVAKQIIDFIIKGLYPG